MTGIDREKGVYAFAPAEARRFHTGVDRSDRPPPVRHSAQKLRLPGFEMVVVTGTSHSGRKAAR